MSIWFETLVQGRCFEWWLLRRMTLQPQRFGAPVFVTLRFNFSHLITLGMFPNAHIENILAERLWHLAGAFSEKDQAAALAAQLGSKYQVRVGS